MAPDIVDLIVTKFGSQAVVAEICEKKQSAVAMWKKRGRIPSDDITRLLDAARERGIDLSPADFFEARVA